MHETMLARAGKQTLRGGRMGAWSTYRTRSASGYESASRTLLVGRSAYLAWIIVYLRADAGQTHFVQLFDCADTSAVVSSSAWNPDMIFEMSPGDTLTITPPKERASFNRAGPGGVVREDDGGYPLDRGILVVDSLLDTAIEPIGMGPTDKVRITARILTPAFANNKQGV